MNRKLLFVSLFSLLFVGNAAAAIDSIAVSNIFPDSEVRFRDTEVVVRLTSDATTSTTVTLYVQKPDGTIIQEDNPQTISVKSGNPAIITFDIDSDDLDQYGDYAFIANHTNNALNDTVETELVPRPNIILSNPNTISVNGNRETYFNLDINTFVGESIPVNELEPGNLTILRITDDPGTSNVIEKTIELEKPLTSDSNTGDLEALINTTDLPEGSYELRADTNITSCDVCQVYPTTTSDVVNIQEDYAFNVYDEKWGGLTASEIDPKNYWGNDSAEGIQDNVDKTETDVSQKVEREADKIAGLIAADPNNNQSLILMSLVLNIMVLAAVFLTS